MSLIPEVMWLVLFPLFTVSLQDTLREYVNCDEHGNLESIKNESSLDKNHFVSDLDHACRNFKKTKDLLEQLSDELDALRKMHCEFNRCLKNLTLYDIFPGLNASQYNGLNNCKKGDSENDLCEENRSSPSSQVDPCLESCFFNRSRPKTDWPAIGEPTVADSPACKETATSSSVAGQTPLAGVTLRDVIISVVSFILGALVMYMVWFIVRRRESSRRKCREQNTANDQQEIFSLSQFDPRNETRNIYNEVDYPAMNLVGAIARNNEPATLNTGRSGSLPELPKSRETQSHLSQCHNTRTYGTLRPDQGEKHLYAIDERGDAIYTPKERTEDSDAPAINNTYAILLPEEQTSKIIDKRDDLKTIDNFNGLESNLKSNDVPNDNALCEQMGETNCCYVSSEEDRGPTTIASGGATSDTEELVPSNNPVKPKVRLSSVVPAPDKNKIDRTSFHEYIKLEKS